MTDNSDYQHEGGRPFHIEGTANAKALWQGPVRENKLWSEGDSEAAVLQKYS